MASKDLLGQRRIFADGLLAGKTQQQAYEDAGYINAYKNLGNACKLAKDPAVKEYVEAAQKKALDRVGVTAAWILDKVVQTTLKAEAEGDHKNVFKGLELLGKNKKLWTDVQEHQFNITQMGSVIVKDHDAIEGECSRVMTFNVGQEPNRIEDARK